MRFEELLREHDVAFLSEGHHHCRPGWLQIDCPFCGTGTRGFHMGYSLAGGYVNCWRCGPHRLHETVAELLHLSLKQAAALLGGLEKDKTRVVVQRGKLVLPRGRGPLLSCHKVYLRSRQYNCKDLVRLWQVQGIGLASRLAWRIFIPIIHQGEIVSWTTRSVKDEGLRYISAAPNEEILNHKDILYGEDYCRHAVVVVEGPFDVWRIGPGAVATLGTGYSRSQVRRLCNDPVRMVCVDNEREAQQRARKLVRLLEPFQGETYNVILSGKDAGSTDAEEIQEIRERFLA